MKKILILGGYGTFGRRIVARLAADDALSCIIGGRSAQRAQALAASLKTEWRQVDIGDSASLRAALTDMFAVVNTCGPFCAKNYDVPQACARQGVHYVDLADSRAYVKGFSKLNAAAQRSNSMLVCGASAVPALSSLLADAIADDFSSIDAVDGFLSLGGRHPRGLAAMRSLLGSVGAPFKMKDGGRWRNACGWTEKEKIAFPAPVGVRATYLCDAPDLDIAPARYAAASASVHAGAQAPSFARLLWLVGWARRRGIVKDPLRLAGGLLRIARWFPGPRKQAGALGVRMRGKKGQAPHTRSAFLVARDNSAADLLCSPAVALIKKWVHAGIATAGASACVGLLTLDDIRAELAAGDRRDIVLILR